MYDKIFLNDVSDLFHKKKFDEVISKIDKNNELLKDYQSGALSFEII